MALLQLNKLLLTYETPNIKCICCTCNSQCEPLDGNTSQEFSIPSDLKGNQQKMLSFCDLLVKNQVKRYFDIKPLEKVIPHQQHFKYRISCLQTCQIKKDTFLISTH